MEVKMIKDVIKSVAAAGIGMLILFILFPALGIHFPVPADEFRPALFAGMVGAAFYVLHRR